MNQWVARHTPWIVTALPLCTILQLVLYLGSHDKKYCEFSEHASKTSRHT